MFIERIDYNKVITIKLVIPGGCNAKCPFCYNKDKKMTCNKAQFLDNFIPSLDNLLNKIEDKNEVSVDITGGEPTLDYEFLIQVLTKLREYNIKSRVLRTTMTTNGVNLDKVIPYLEGVIDYINISIHSHKCEERYEITGMKFTEYDYFQLVQKLKAVGIDTSASAVIYKDIPNFNSWRDDFIFWARTNGFKAIRFRCDVFWKDAEIFDNYLLSAKYDNRFDVITYENTTDSHWLRLRDKETGFRVFFLHGVLDTSLLTKGIEYVIDDDGKCYCDYYKRIPIEKYEYEIGKIYDKMEG